MVYYHIDSTAYNKAELFRRTAMHRAGEWIVRRIVAYFHGESETVQTLMEFLGATETVIREHPQYIADLMYAASWKYADPSVAKALEAMNWRPGTPSAFVETVCVEYNHIRGRLLEPKIIDEMVKQFLHMRTCMFGSQVGGSILAVSTEITRHFCVRFMQYVPHPELEAEEDELRRAFLSSISAFLVLPVSEMYKIPLFHEMMHFEDIICFTGLTCVMVCNGKPVEYPTSILWVKQMLPRKGWMRRDVQKEYMEKFLKTFPEEEEEDLWKRHGMDWMDVMSNDRGNDCSIPQLFLQNEPIPNLGVFAKRFRAPFKVFPTPIFNWE
jgi:hypothetical protein